MSVNLHVQPAFVGQSSLLTIQVAFQNPLVNNDQLSIPPELTQDLTVVSPGVKMSQNRQTLIFSEIKSSQKSLIMTCNFQNPSSINDQNYIITQTRNNTVIDKQSVTISNLQPMTMQQASIKSIDDQIGSQNGTLSFNLTVMQGIPQNGKIKIKLPDPTTLQQSQIFSATPKCYRAQSLLSCQFNENYLVLQVLEELPAGTQFIFTVSPVKNPYNGNPLSGFQITTTTKEDYLIQKSDLLSFQVSKPGNFQIISLKPNVSTVGSLSVYELSFKLNFPIDPQCMLKITAPFDIAQTLLTVTGQEMFKSQNFTVQDNFASIYGCKKFINEPQETLLLQQIKNPMSVKDSQPFKIEIFSNNKIVASGSISVPQTYFTPGMLESVKIFSSNPIVQEMTNLTLSFVNSNQIPVNNKLVIDFPIQLPQACNLAGPLQNVLKNPGKCEILNNTLVLYNFTSGLIPQGSTIGFTLNGFINSMSSTDAGNFNFQTYDSEYIVDQISLQNVYKPQPGSALFTKPIKSSSQLTYDGNVTYSVYFQAQHHVPLTGQINVTFPDSITTGDFSQISQNTLIDYGDGLKSVKLISSQQSQLTFGLSQSITAKSQIEIQIPGIINPRSTAKTQSLVIQTQDQDGHIIDKLSSNLDVTMTKPNQLLAFSVTPKSLVNSDITTYQFDLQSQNPMLDGDHLKFFFPQEIRLPNALTCLPGQNVKSVSCINQGNFVDLMFTFFSGILQPKTNFTFFMQNIQNPQSTKPTSPFTSTATFDKDQNSLSVYTSDLVTVKMIKPAKINQASIGSSTYQPNSNVTYTLNFQTINALPQNAAITIQIPLQIIPNGPINLCNMTANSITARRQCQLFTQNNTILMTDNFPYTIPASSQVQLNLGTFISPSNLVYQSLTVTTYADQQATFMVDQSAGNMIPGIQCKSPCKGCSSPQFPTQCTQCFQDGPFPNLYTSRGFSTCLAQCPEGYYSDFTQKCQQCYSTCLTCSSYPQCSSCNTQSGFPYLYQSGCISICPSGTYPDEQGHCVPCVSPCLSCTGPQNGQCTSCLQNIPTSNLVGNTCVSQCPKGTLQINNECLQCSNGCATCQITQDQCLSCQPGLLLLGNSCLPTCPTGFFSDLATGQCLVCQNSCASCSTGVTQCDSCKSDFYFLNKKCLTECPQGYYKDKKQGLCTKCDQKCKSCLFSGQNEQCIECNSGLFLFNGTCEIGCPRNFTRNDITKNCDANKIFVPTVFDTHLICSEIGSNLNSHTVLYFPITIGLAVLIFILFVTYLCYKNTYLLELTIAITSPLELIALFETCRQAFLVEGVSGFECIADRQTQQLRKIYPIISYVTLGLSLLYIALNITSLLVLIKNKKLKEDPEFQVWMRHNKNSSWILVLVFQTAFSFKFCWLLVSNLLGQKRYNANFNDSTRKIFNRNMTHFGISFIACINAPVLMVVISGLLTYKWGAQIVISLIDIALVTVILAVLQIYQLSVMNKKQYDMSIHKTPIMVDCGIDFSIEKEEEEVVEEIDYSLSDDDIQVDETGQKFMVAEDGEKIFIGEKGERFCVDENGARVDFGTSGEKIYKDENGQSFMKTDDGEKIFIAEDGTFYQVDWTGMRQEIKKDDPLISKISKVKKAAVKMRKSIDDMIDELDYDELSILPDVDDQFGTADDLMPSMTFGCYEFNAHEIIGYVEYKDFKFGQEFDKVGRKINKQGYLLDGVRNIVDFDSFKVLDRRYLNKTRGRFPEMLNFYGQNFQIKEILGRLIRDEKNGRAILKQHISTQKFWDRDAHEVNQRGYLIDIFGNVINKRGKVVFYKSQLLENGEIPKIFSFTKFDIQLITGRFSKKSNGKPRLKKDKLLQSLRRDDDGHLVNQLGYLCDSQGNIIDQNGKKILDFSVLQDGQEIPAIFLKKEHLIKLEGNITSNANSKASLVRQQSILEEDGEDEEFFDTPRNKRAITIQTSFFKNEKIESVKEESDSITTEEEQPKPVNEFLDKLRINHHGHAFGYIGDPMISAQRKYENRTLNSIKLFFMKSLSKDLKKDPSSSKSAVQSPGLPPQSPRRFNGSMSPPRQPQRSNGSISPTRQPQRSFTRLSIKKIPAVDSSESSNIQSQRSSIAKSPRQKLTEKFNSTQSNFVVSILPKHVQEQESPSPRKNKIQRKNTNQTEKKESKKLDSPIKKPSTVQIGARIDEKIQKKVDRAFLEVKTVNKRKLKRIEDQYCNSSNRSNNLSEVQKARKMLNTNLQNQEIVWPDDDQEMNSRRVESVAYSSDK